MQKLYYRLCLLVIFFITLSFHIQAQTVSGVEVNIVGDNLQITYAMAGLRDGQKFNVELYSSIDNYAAPLTDERITGDLGANISLGSGNMITIGEPLETLGAITGDLNFKVKTTMIFNPVTVIDPITFFKQKRGKKFTTVWNGGLPGELVTFDLYKNNDLIRDNFYSTNNNRSAEFKFPKVDLGTGYSMMMDFESLPNDVQLPDFEVKRKSSIFGKVFLLVVVAAAADFYLYGSSSDVAFLEPKTVRTEDFKSFFFGKFYDPLEMTNNELPPPPGNPDQVSLFPFITIPFN
jgi:hypothetical protein